MAFLDALLFGFAVVNFGVGVALAIKENKACIWSFWISGLCVFGGLF